MLRRLKVPQRDQRRGYIKILFHYINTFDFDNLSGFMKQSCTDDFIFHLKGKYSVDAYGRKTYFPKFITVNGVDSFITFVSNLGECAPDRFYIVKETIIRNREDCSFVLCRFIFSGTLVYHLQIKHEEDPSTGPPPPPLPSPRASMRHIDKKIRPNSPVEKSPVNSFAPLPTSQAEGFQDLDSLLVDNISITSNEDLRVGDMFRNGGVTSNNIEGTATLYLNKDGKVRKLEFDFTESKDTNWVKIVQHQKRHQP